MTSHGPFNRPDVVTRYLGLHGLLDSEQHLFDAVITAHDRVLDLGVGVGRTSRYLADRSFEYLGVDIAPNMIAEARTLHHDLRFEVGDATDLAHIDDARFDVVVFSFNGLDYITERSQRLRALRSVHRVLRNDGAFIFSSHDPRAVLARPNPVLGVKARPVAAFQTIRRVFRRGAVSSCVRGHGVVTDYVHGGLPTYMSAPRYVRSDLATCGFELVEQIPGPNGCAGSRFGTEWWYYLATRR